MAKNVPDRTKPKSERVNRKRTMAVICGLISSSDKGLHEICNSRDFLPTARSVQRWLVEDDELRRMYACAKNSQADHLADQIRQIADECRIGKKTVLKEGKDGTYTETVTADMVERSRLQIDARKWLAAKLAPNKYGDRTQVVADISVEHTVGGIIGLVMGQTRPLVQLEGDVVDVPLIGDSEIASVD